MDRETRRRFEGWRAQAPDPQNTVVDDLFAGECDRAGFIQRATMFGLSTSAISAALLAAGEAPAAFAKQTRGKAGGRIRVGLTPVPAGNLEPWTYQETVALQLGGMAGEFLNRNKPNLTLVPELAVSWKPNATATEWTYKLRQGVKFANGKPFGADDVIATYTRLLTDPKTTATSAYNSALSPGGMTKVDDLTVTFKMDSPYANFPYLTSSSTYQAIILPKDYVGPFEKTPQTTGAFMLVAYTPGVSAKYDRNPNWWGGTPPLEGIDCTLGDDTAINNALLGGQIDLRQGVIYSAGQALFNNPNIQLWQHKSATHRQIPMRVDTGVLKNKLVRQAIALTLDRPAILNNFFHGFGDLGNDSPFAPVYPSSVKVAQRHKDIRKAKELIASAGLKKGWSINMVTYKTGELANLAQIVQGAIKQIGGKINLKVETSSQYFAGKPTEEPWLNAQMTATDWGHRGVPNVLLNSAFTTKGIPSNKNPGGWNAAHFSNKKYDALYKSFAGALALKDQRKYAKQIELLLLDQTPVIIPYFYNAIDAGVKKISGYDSDQLGEIYLSHASIA